MSRVHYTWMRQMTFTRKLSTLSVNDLQRFLHDFAITAWACSIMPEIMLDVKRRMTGYHRNAIETCIRRLFAHDIDGQEDDEIDLKVDKFWDEFDNF